MRCSANVPSIVEGMTCYLSPPLLSNDAELKRTVDAGASRDV